MTDNYIDAIIALLGTSQRYPDKTLGVDAMKKDKVIEDSPDYYYSKPGLELLLTEKDDIFYQLNVQVNPDRINTVAYEGILPYTLTSHSDQTDIHQIFGAPLETYPPTTISIWAPTGGTERFDSPSNPGVAVFVGYTPEMTIRALTLIYKSADPLHR